jgi:hypothetical protein
MMLKCSSKKFGLHVFLSPRFIVKITKIAAAVAPQTRCIGSHSRTRHTAIENLDDETLDALSIVSFGLFGA